MLFTCSIYAVNHVFIKTFITISVIPVAVYQYLKTCCATVNVPRLLQRITTSYSLKSRNSH